MEFKDRLKKYRTDAGITQEALGIAIHVSRSAVAKWEAGLGLPGEDSLIALCEYFSVTRADLIPNAEADALLVDKNIKLKKHRLLTRLLAVILGVALLAMVAVAAFLLCTNIVREQKAYFRSELYPTVTKIYFNDKGLKLDTVYMNKGSYILTENQACYLFIRIEMDARLTEGITSFSVKLDGFETLTEPRPIYENVVSGNDGAKLYSNVYMISVMPYEIFEGDITFEYFDLFQTVDGFREQKAAVIKAETLPVRIEESAYVNVSVKFHTETLYSCSVKKGSTLRDSLLSGSEYELLEAIVKSRLASVFDSDCQLVHNGWYVEDGSSLDDGLFTDAVLMADVNLSDPNSEIELCVRDDDIWLYAELYPRFILDGRSYGNITYNLTSDSNILKITDGGKKIKAISPGTATVTVDYDLGFAKGSTYFTVTVAPYANISIFAGPINNGVSQTVRCNYDENLGDIVFPDEKYAEYAEYFESLNTDFELETGCKREFLGLQRVSDTLYLPVFETEYELDLSRITILINGERMSVTDVMSTALSFNVGDKISVGFEGVADKYTDFDFVWWFADDDIVSGRVAESVGNTSFGFCVAAKLGDAFMISDVYTLQIVVTE